jgi:1-acyl-sn-glycerol-3-phosphate acyltransferase
MQPAYTVPVHSRLFRWLFCPIFRGVFHLLCKINIQGKENIPAQAPYLVAINHVSLYEPPFVLAFWPRPLEAAGAVDIWQRRGQSTLAHLYGGIQVHRGQYDRQLIDRMLAAVAAGYPLLIAPEGGRTHTLDMRRALPGAAYIVHKAGVPVIPVGIIGTTDDLFFRIRAAFQRRGPRPILEMRIGRPIQIPPASGRGEERRLALQHNADLIMMHIGALLPLEYHGVYADQIAELV